MGVTNSGRRWGLSAAIFVVLAGAADAGTGVWTSGGPNGGTVNALAIDPAVPATLYAGTSGGGAFKSTDSGGTWAAINTGLVSPGTSPWIFALVVNPTSTSTLYAGTGGGVYKSTDSGGTWVAANTGLTSQDTRALAINPATPTTLYAATSGGGVFKSTNSGGSWVAANAGLTNLTLRALTIHPTSPATLYAGTYDGGVYKTTDSGGTWASVNAGLTNLYVAALAIHPTLPATLYAGMDGGGIFKSTDSGGSWAPASSGLTDPSVRALVIDPATPSTLYVGTWFEGVFRSSDSGGSWAVVSAGLTSLTVGALAIHPAMPATLYAGVRGGGVFESSNSGGSWAVASTGLTSLTVNALATPGAAATFYCGTSDAGVFKSTDSGASWSEANSGLTSLDVLSLVVTPTVPTTLYAGTPGSGIFKSTNSGGSWAAANTGLTSPGITALAVHPSVGATLYAGTWDGLVFKSSSAGGSWAVASTGLSSSYINALAIDPVTPTTLYAGTLDGVFKSTNAGGSWASASAGLTHPYVQALAVDPGNPAVLYAGLPFGGVFKSTDSGSTWTAANTGLDDLTVRALAIDPTTPTRLVAGTDTGKAYQTADSAGHWVLANAGLPGLAIFAMAADSVNTFYAGTYGGSVRAWTPGPPTFTISDASAAEAAGQLSLTVSLAGVAPGQVTVAYSTSNGTAVAGTDYTATSGVLTFPLGTVSRTITVPVLDDAIGEPDETLSVNLSNPSGAQIADSRGIGTLVNDDGASALTIAGGLTQLSVSEGNSGTTNAIFTVTLSPPRGYVVTVDYETTVAGSATPWVDFTPVQGSLSFAPFAVSRTFTVPVIGDTTPELDETFNVRLIGPVGATIAGGGQGSATILNDDSSSGAFEALDPACTGATSCDGAAYLKQRNTCGQTAFLTNDTALLRQANVTRTAVVADSVTLLLLRMPSSVPVTFSLKLQDGTPPTGEEVGALMDRNACNRGTSVSVNPELAAGSNYVFAAYQAPRWTIPASGSVQIIATPQGGPAATQIIELRRPPVVLVHGVWSGPDTWRQVPQPGQQPRKWTDLLRDAGFDTAEACLADYSATPAGSFDPLDSGPGPINALVVATECMRKKVRAEQNAAVTQVDVVGHSLGGVTARARVKSAAHPYYKVTNLNAGEFHKIITIGSPHLATPLGDLLVKEQCRAHIFDIGPLSLANVLTLAGMPMGPAIFGFQTSSKPIAHIGATPVPGHTVAGTGPLLSALELKLNSTFSIFGINTTIGTLLGPSGSHDVIVPVASQRGGLAGSLTSTVTGVTHPGELKSLDVVTEVINLLGLPTTPSNFGSFPAFQPSGTYREPYSCQTPLASTTTLSGALVLTPTAGEVYRPGEPVVVTATLTDGAVVAGLSLSLGGEQVSVDGVGPWSWTFTPSATRGGRIDIAANTHGGTDMHLASTYIVVLPAGSPIQLTAAPTPMSFAVMDDTEQIHVSGLYDDGGEYDLSSGAAGTTYLSSNTAVATVTADGQVQARGNGTATISVANGTSSANVDVTVAITNAVPTLAAIPNVTMLPGQSRDVQISATDPNGNTLTIAGVDLPAFATVTDNGDGTGVVHLQPVQADLGTHLLLVSVTDNGNPPLGAMRELRVLVRSPKGDIDSDCSTDLVFRSTLDGAQNMVWLMNGVARWDEGAIVPDAASADWKIRGVDDFDADGVNDLVFWNQVTGVVEFWIMNGTTRVGAPVPVSGAPTLAVNWDLAATADFNHDGQADVVWRNSVSQKIVIWTMNGTSRAGALIPVPDQAVNANWAVVGALDYNADGNTDFLWYNPDSGKIVFWFMDAAVHRITGQFANPASAGNNNWKVLAAGDYGIGPNGFPSTQDMVWRNATSGKYVVWHMDTAGNRTAGTFTSPDAPAGALDWILVGPR